MNARTQQLRGSEQRTFRVRGRSQAEAAHLYRLQRATDLLVEAGYFEHRDGNWYPEPEAPPSEDD